MSAPPSEVVGHVDPLHPAVGDGVRDDAPVLRSAFFSDPSAIFALPREFAATSAALTSKSPMSAVLTCPSTMSELKTVLAA